MGMCPPPPAAAVSGGDLEVSPVASAATFIEAYLRTDTHIARTYTYTHVHDRYTRIHIYTYTYTHHMVRGGAILIGWGIGMGDLDRVGCGVSL